MASNKTKIDTCSVPECYTPHTKIARGYCKRHYYQFMKYGEIKWPGKYSISDEHRDALKKGYAKHGPTGFATAPPLEEANHFWKGEEASYAAKHAWIKRKKGSPPQCEVCNKIDHNPHAIQWANLSREYKREFADWMRMCSSCHKYYDLQKIKETGKRVFA